MSDAIRPSGAEVVGLRSRGMELKGAATFGSAREWHGAPDVEALSSPNRERAECPEFGGR